MTEIIYILLFIIGLVILLKGADIITEFASRIARERGISEIVIGITLVAIATSLPELAVSVASALSGVATIAIGTIIGSNIANLGLVLGVSALIAPFLTKPEFLKQGYFMVAYSFLAFFLIIGGLFWFEGIVLIAVAMIYLAWLVKSKKKMIAYIDGVAKKNHIAKYMAFCVLGGIGVVLGANLIVTSTIEIAKWMGISEMVISLIVIAVGTSLPELVTSAVAAKKRMRGISLGNIIGSNIFNIMILGISSLIVTAPVTGMLIMVNLPIMLLISTLHVLLRKTGWMISRKEALLFIIIYAAFIMLQLTWI